MAGSARHITKSASPRRIPVLSRRRACPEFCRRACPELAEGKGIGFVFPYFQNFGPFLALEVDITLETIPLLRHDAAPPLNVISRLTTVFRTPQKPLMSSGQPSPGLPPARRYVAAGVGRRSGCPLRYVATRQSHSAGPKRKRLSHACDHHTCSAHTANTNTNTALRFT